jgi:ABC-type transport system involved in cytochrome c biogenesis permease subunit
MLRNSTQPRSDHREAMLLAWKSIHVPVGTILLGTLLLSGVFSAVSTLWGYGPVSPIP